MKKDTASPVSQMSVSAVWESTEQGEHGHFSNGQTLYWTSPRSRAKQQGHHPRKDTFLIQKWMNKCENELKQKWKSLNWSVLSSQGVLRKNEELVGIFRSKKNVVFWECSASTYKHSRGTEFSPWVPRYWTGQNPWSFQSWNGTVRVRAIRQAAVWEAKRNGMEALPTEGGTSPSEEYRKTLWAALRSKRWKAAKQMATPWSHQLNPRRTIRVFFSFPPTPRLFTPLNHSTYPLDSQRVKTFL